METKTFSSQFSPSAPWIEFVGFALLILAARMS